MIVLSPPADPPYVDGALCDGAGAPLRPGGEDLTRQAIDCGGWRPGDKVIDVGCGLGGTLDLLQDRGMQAVGVDISERVLQLARRQAGGRVVVRASGEALPFADGGADGVLAECSLSLMPRPAAAIGEFYRVLRPGGRLVVTDVYSRAPAGLERPVMSGCFSGMLEKEATIRRLEHAGFGVDRWQDHSDLLKAFVTRFIFEHGSLDALWGGCGSAAAARRLRPGYALLVARKGDAAPRHQSLQIGRIPHG